MPPNKQSSSWLTSQSQTKNPQPNRLQLKILCFPFEEFVSENIFTWWIFSELRLVKEEYNRLLVSQ